MRFGNYRLIGVLAGFILAVNSTCVFAQTPPSGTDAGVINKNTQNINIQRDKEIKEKKKSSDSEIKPPSTNDKETPAVLKETKIKLNQVIFSGNTAIETSKLDKITANYIGNNVAIADLRRLTKQITSLYQGEGYITSFAYLPPQKVKDGVVEIAISEGKVGNIEVEGNKWVRASYLKNNMLKANDLKEQHIFNVKDLRKSLSEVNKQDYLKGEVTIERGAEPDTSNIILNVKDRFPLNFYTGWDNQGTKLVGVKRATLGGGIENLTGFGDKLSAYTALASGTTGVGTNYSLPIGSYGTELSAGYSMSDIALGGAYRQERWKGRSHSYTTGLFQPLYKGDSFTLTSDLGFDMTHSETTMMGTGYISKYNLRVLRTGLNGIKDDSTGRWISRIQASMGLPLANAAEESSYGLGSSKFFKLNTDLIRVQSLPWQVTGVFKASYQYTPDALMAPEQIQLGGMNSVRGFSESLVLGDVGYILSAEFKRPIPYLPNITFPLLPKKFNTLKLKNNIQFATFYDQGWSREIHRSGDTRSNLLQSVGVGLRCYINKYIMASFDLGFPIGPFKEQGAKFHFSLTSDLI